jgi:hypothetical protein
VFLLFSESVSRSLLLRWPVSVGYSSRTLGCATLC